MPTWNSLFLAYMDGDFGSVERTCRDLQNNLPILAVLLCFTNYCHSADLRAQNFRRERNLDVNRGQSLGGRTRFALPADAGALPELEVLDLRPEARGGRLTDLLRAAGPWQTLPSSFSAVSK